MTDAVTASANAPHPVPCRIRQMGVEPYRPVWEAMRAFTGERTPQTPDELWLLQHQPVYTLGQAGKHEHILDPHGIEVVQIDRGGQVTYHGPGQLVVYLLVDLRRRGLGVRQLVDLIEQSLIRVLGGYDVSATTRDGAPGVYVGERKIAALGLRVRRGCAYHGLSFNIDMDLSPFSWINPCGFQGLQTTQLRDLVTNPGPDLFEDAREKVLGELTRNLV